MSAFGYVKPGLKPTDRGTAMPTSTAVGSGSRPGNSKVKIDCSDPDNPHTMDRNPPNPLK